MRAVTNSIPVRELHWKKYSYLRCGEDKTYFMCECGKKYSSFAALYLHFERKHGQKIKNLHDPSQFQTIYSKSEKVHLFYLKTKKSKFAEKQKKETSKLVVSILGVATILQEFQQDCQAELRDFSEPNHIENLFKKFNEFYSCSMLKRHRTNEIEGQDLIASLPYEFNNFMVSHSFSTSLEYELYCEILLLLSRWLNRQKYSDLVLVYNLSQKKDLQSVEFTQ